jgi:LTXXQ motif family protein
MRKLVVAGVTALFVTASPLAHAQTPSPVASMPVTATDWGMMTDARVEIVKAALQLTPDQEKYWPAIEDAIRARAEHRQARLAAVATRIGELRNGGLIEALRNRDPVDLLQRRAEALAQRAGDLKKLADAWQPLYQTLQPDQKRRMALLTVFVLRETGSAVRQRLQSEDQEDMEAED